MIQDDSDALTHFGFKTVTAAQKTQKVAEVFHSVANQYDLMNDLMSFGLHRLWKQFAIKLCQIRPDHHILDCAGGTGDLTQILSPRLCSKGSIVLGDINSSMLTVAKDRLLDRGIHENVNFVQLNAEQLPFKNDFFDRIIMGFGLRNVTCKLTALKSLYRVLKPGGFLIVLEFSKPYVEVLKSLYDTYSFQVIPRLGQLITRDEKSYQYLVESIRKHPDQKELCTLFSQAGFEDCDFHNLSGGITAVHRGYKY